MERLLHERLAALSLEQKVRLLTGADFWALHAEPAVGLRRIVMSDGPAGVRGSHWDEREPSANVPAPVALAATWDEAGVSRLGRLLALEARRKGVDVLLAPTVNLHRTPLGGRAFECFSEDPLLTGRIGAAFVRGLQESGVAATVKHFVANDSETERFTLDARVDERTLRELYLEPFSLIMAAHPWAVMAAYNAVNGTTMTESPLLRDVLKDEWGWDGLVVSDWGAARSTEGAGAAALDLAMPGPSGPFGDALVEAVRDGRVSAEAVDDKVLRLLRLAARVGALDGVAPPHPAGTPDPAAPHPAATPDRAAPDPAGAPDRAAPHPAGAPDRAAPHPAATPDRAALDPAGAPDRAAPHPAATPDRAALDPAGAPDRAAPHAAGAPDQAAPRPGAPRVPPPPPLDVPAELRAQAAASFVLARNRGTLLPLSGRSLRRVAVVGPNAAVARTLGGGSATVVPAYTVSPLDGLRSALGGEVTHAPGVRASTRPAVADVEAEVRFVGADGRLLGSERRATGEFTWLGTLDPAVAAVEVHATLVADRAGSYLVGCSGAGRHRLSVRGTPAFDVALALGAEADPGEALFAPPSHGLPLTLAAGEAVDVVLQREVDGPLVAFQLNFDPPFGDAGAELERAVALARAADVAIVVVGTTPEVESEGFDRTTLALPGRQDELVRRVNAANPRTVVVVNAGAPVLMPWLDEVPAVLLTWFGGQETGNALADVLLGAAEPGGRLPSTWPATDGGLPSVTPVDGVLPYAEGLAIGYRGPVEPALPFGHGLGYTTWEYLGMDGATVRLVNAGTRRGREVVQVYASRPGSAVARPPRWLAGFAVVDADAGQEVVVDVPLGPRAFQHWDGGWQTEPGAFVLEAGRSVADLRVRSTT